MIGVVQLFAPQLCGRVRLHSKQSEQAYGSKAWLCCLYDYALDIQAAPRACYYAVGFGFAVRFALGMFFQASTELFLAMQRATDLTHVWLRGGIVLFLLLKRHPQLRVWIIVVSTLFLIAKVDPLRELEPLDVVWHEGYWRSLSNRRLWTLKHCTAAMTDQPLYVRVRVRQKDAEFRAKWNSTNDGVSVLVVNRTRSPSPARVR